MLTICTLAGILRLIFLFYCNLSSSHPSSVHHVLESLPTSARSPKPVFAVSTAHVGLQKPAPCIAALQPRDLNRTRFHPDFCHHIFVVAHKFSVLLKQRKRCKNTGERGHADRNCPVNCPLSSRHVSLQCKPCCKSWRTCSALHILWCSAVCESLSLLPVSCHHTSVAYGASGSKHKVT